MSSLLTTSLQQTTTFDTTPKTTTTPTTTLSQTTLSQTTLSQTTTPTTTPTTTSLQITSQTTFRETLPPRPTTIQTTTAQPNDSIYQLGFIVGMGLMGGFLILIVTFMIVTSCQRAYKAKKKRLALKEDDKILKVENDDAYASDAYTSDAYTSEDSPLPLEEIKIV